MRLVIFDVDGTLTQTTAIDAQCFRQACTDLYGFTSIDCDWTHYVHATDPGILREIFEFRSGRRLVSDDLARFRKYFVGLLHTAAQRTPFSPVVGAPELFVQLSRDHRVALATGCWADAARVKMRSAGMHYDEYFSASADDDESREGIIRIAFE